MGDLWIENGTIITLDQERRIIRNGVIHIQGSKILYVGKPSGLEQVPAGDVVVNAEDKLVLPGFINTHMHLEYSGIGRGIADDLPLARFVNERVRPAEAVTKAEEAYLSALLVCIDMIRNGTTCVCDTGGFYPDAVAQAALDSGMRAAIAHGSMDAAPLERPLLGTQLMSTSENLRRTEELIQSWHGREDDRIRVRCSLRTLPNASEQLILDLNNIAENYDVGVNIHLSDTAEVVESAKKARGYREIEYLDHLGVLSPRWMGIHMIWLSDNEVEIIKRRKMKVSHCPGAATHLGFGCTQVGKFVE